MSAKNNDPAFLFYSNSWFGDTNELELEEKGAYIDLMAHQHQTGSIPNDIKKLAKICRCQISEMEQVWPNIKDRFDNHTVDRMVNRRLETVINQRSENALKRKIIGHYALLIRQSDLNKKQVLDIKKEFKLSNFINLQNPTERLTEWFTNWYNRTVNVNVNVNEDVNSSNTLITKNYKSDFKIYKWEALTALKEILSDTYYIKQRQEYHPGLNIKLSLEKAWRDYWITEAGWKKKKAARADSIDWKKTASNALSLKCNQVWLTKDQREELDTMRVLVDGNKVTVTDNGTTEIITLSEAQQRGIV